MPVEFVEKSVYGTLKEDEIKQIAKDILAGLVFTNFHIPSGDEAKYLHAVRVIFCAITQVDQATAHALHKEPPGMMYEYLTKEVTKTKDGWPIFSTVLLMSVEDAEKVWNYYHKYKEAMESVE